MKKLISLFLVFCIFFLNTQFCFAEELNLNLTKNIPLWEDYCPNKYLNAKYKPGKIGKINNYSWSEDVLAITLIGYPLALRKFDERQEYNYWTERRYTFKNNLKVCLDNPGDKTLCFNRVAEIEQVKNLQKPQKMSTCQDFRTLKQIKKQVRQMEKNRQDHKENKQTEEEIAQKQWLIKSLNNMQNDIQVQQSEDNGENLNNPKKAIIVNTKKEENYCGIGARIAKTDKDFIIQEVLYGGAAYKAKLRMADIINKVDDVDINHSYLSLEKVLNLVKGKQGTIVNITFTRNNKTYTIPLTREIIDMSTSKGIPRWENFCPAEFCYSQYSDYKSNDSLYAFLAISVIGLPWAVVNSENHKQADNNNYWTNRRYSFEDNIGVCLDNQGDKAACLMQVVQIEQNKNQQLQQNEMAQRMLYQSAANNMQHNIQAQQLNNNLNNINNSIQMLRY